MRKVSTGLTSPCPQKWSKNKTTLCHISVSKGIDTASASVIAFYRAPITMPIISPHSAARVFSFHSSLHSRVSFVSFSELRRRAAKRDTFVQR